MKRKTGILLSLLTVVILYLLFSSTVIVKPGTVTIVKELRSDGDSIGLVSRPLINNERGNRLFFKQPIIPGTGIGYIDEVYNPLLPYSFETSFALYTLDQVTGNSEDRDKVRAYTISGTIGEINNWENFLEKLNVVEVNKNRSVYSKKYESRVEILAEQLKFLLRTPNPEQYYPYGAGTDEEIMNLGQKISWLQQELVSRRNFLAALQDKYSFTDADYYRQFLMDRAPWYWVMGVDRYEELINHARNLREYEQSIYSEVISRRGSANKYIADEDYLNLINMMGKVNYYEQNLLNNEEIMANLQSYRRKIYREISQSDLDMSQAITRGFDIYLKEEKQSLIQIPQEQLTSVLSRYINTDLLSALEKGVNYEKLLLNIEYLGVYEQQVMNSYEYSEEDFAEVEIIYSYIIKNYDDMLKKENWENYMPSVNKEFSKILESNPQITLPEEKIQVLANYRLYAHYLKNIEPALQRNHIGESHYLNPMMQFLKSYSELFLSDTDTIKQLLTGWLQHDEADFIKGAASLISYQWQRERTLRSLANLDDFKAMELEPYIFFESRNYDLDESERLWDAAIEDITSGSGLESERTFTFHNVGDGESIDSISHYYGVNPFDIFYENRYTMEFSDTVTRSDLNTRMEYESFTDLFDSSRDLKLKSDQSIYIPGKEIYSETWLDLHEKKQDLREFYINRYIFSNLEDMVADAFYEFINKTDYISHLEHNYGVEFASLDFSIEDRSFFSNPRTGEIDHDFMDLYYQKAIR